MDVDFTLLVTDSGDTLKDCLTSEGLWPESLGRLMSYLLTESNGGVLSLLSVDKC